MIQPPVPLVDLSHQQRPINEAIKEGFNRVIAESSFVMGPPVEEFEKTWAAYCQVKHALGVANGTDALELALRAAGVGQGDEVIVPANTFVATAGAVLRSGANLVLADCDENFLVGPADVAQVLSAKTKAVIGVHLYGQAAPMEAIRKVIPAGVTLIEDMAQAQGAIRLGRRAGSLADVAATSFYPGKNLGAYGDAGAVMTSSSDVYARLQRLRNHGGTARYEHLEIGFNSRLDTLQAVVLNAKLALLDQWNHQRAAAAALYQDLLGDLEEVALPRILPGNEHVFHLYVVRVQQRDRVVRELRANGIGAGIHYPLPVHMVPAYAFLGKQQGTFPRAEAYSRQILSLPLFPGITADQQERVADTLRATLRR